VLRCDCSESEQSSARLRRYRRSFAVLQC